MYAKVHQVKLKLLFFPRVTKQSLLVLQLKLIWNPGTQYLMYAMILVMARLARVVVPKIPHHITQRGNRRQKEFFQDEDYQEYLNLISHWSKEEGVEIWNYCLMHKPCASDRSAT